MALLDDIAESKALDLAASQAQDNLDKTKKEADSSIDNPKDNLAVSLDSIKRNVSYKKKVLNITSGFAKDKAALKYEQDKKNAEIAYKYNLLSSLYGNKSKEYSGSPGERLYQAKKDQYNNKMLTALLNRGKSLELAKNEYEGSLKGIEIGKNEGYAKIEAERQKVLDDLMIPQNIVLKSRLTAQENQRQMTIDISKQNMDLRMNYTSEILGMVATDLVEAEGKYGNNFLFGAGSAFEGLVQGGAHLVDTSLDSLEWMAESFLSLVSGNGLAKWDGNNNFEKFMRRLGFSGENVSKAGSEYFSIYDRIGASYVLNQTAFSIPEMVMLVTMTGSTMKGASLLRTPNIDMLNKINQNFSNAINAARKAGNADKVLILQNMQKAVVNELHKRIPRRQLTGYINSLVYKAAEGFLTKYPHLKNEIANIVANPSLARSLSGLGDGAGKMVLSAKDVRQISSLTRQLGRAASTSSKGASFWLTLGLSSMALELGRRVHMQMEQRGQGAKFTWMDLFSGLNHMLVDLVGAVATVGGGSKLFNKPMFGEGSFGFATPLGGAAGIAGGMGIEGIGEVLQTYWELNSANNYNLPGIDEILRNPAKFKKEYNAFQESFVIGALSSGLIAVPSRAYTKIADGAANLLLKRQQERLREVLEEQERQGVGIRDQAYDAHQNYASAQQNMQNSYNNMSSSAAQRHQASTQSAYHKAAQAQAQAQAAMNKHLGTQSNQANQSTTSQAQQQQQQQGSNQTQQQQTQQQTQSTPANNGVVPVVSNNNAAAEYALQQKLVEKQEKLAERRRQAQANNNTLTAEEAQQIADLESDVAEIQEAISNLEYIDSMYHRDTLMAMTAKELEDNTDPLKEKSLLDLQDKIANAQNTTDLQSIMEDIKENPYISINKKDLEDLNKFYRKEERSKNKYSTNARIEELNEDESTYQDLDDSTNNIQDASDDSNTTTRQGMTQPNQQTPSPDPNATQNNTQQSTAQQSTPDPNATQSQDQDVDTEEVDRSKTLEDAVAEIEKHEKVGHNEAVRKLIKDIFNTLSYEEQMYLLAKKYNSKQAEALKKDYVLVRVRDVTSLSDSPISPTAEGISSRRTKAGMTNEGYHYIWVRRYFNDIDLDTNSKTLTDMIDETFRKVSAIGGIGLTQKFKTISSLIRQISTAKQANQDTADLEQQLDTAIIELQSLVLNYTEDVKELLDLYNFLFKNTSDFDLKRIIANNMEIIQRNFLDSIKEFKDIKAEIDNIKNNTEPLTENFFHKLKSQIKTKVFSNLFDYARALIDNPKNPNRASRLQQAFDEIENFINKVSHIFEDANGELHKLSLLLEKQLDGMKFHIDNYFKTQFEKNRSIEIGIPAIETGQNMKIELGQSGQNVLDNILSFVGLLTQGLGFTRSYHKMVCRKLIRAMKTTSTKYAPLPEVIYGFAQMFNTSEDVIPYKWKNDNQNSYSATIKEIILRDIPLDKLPPDIRENIKNTTNVEEKRKVMSEYINDVFFSDNKSIEGVVNNKIEARLAKLEPVFQAGLIGYANAIVNSTQYADIEKHENFKIFTPEAIRESMWKTAKDILDIKNINDSEAEMLKGIMWSYSHTYFGDMRINQDLSQGRNGNRVVGQINYNTRSGETNQAARSNQNNRLKVINRIYKADEAIDMMFNEKDVFGKEGQGLIVVSNSLITDLKDNFEDSFDNLQNKSNLAKINNNMSSNLRNVLRILNKIRSKKNLSKKDENFLKSNSIIKYSIYPEQILNHLAESLGIKVSDIVEVVNGKVTKVKDAKRISHKHYKELQDKFKRKDKLTKQDIDEMKDILQNPARSEENPLNYIPVLVKNEEGKLEFQYFYYPYLTIQNSAYCMHIGFDMNDIAIGESMENYMDKIYTQLREVGSLMSALNNAIHHRTKIRNKMNPKNQVWGEEFDYSTEGNEVNFLSGVYFVTAIQNSSGRIHYDHPLFSPTSNKWVQCAFNKERKTSQRFRKETNTENAVDGERKKKSKYFQDQLSTTTDTNTILSMEIAFSDVFNIDVDKYTPTALFKEIKDKVNRLFKAFFSGKIDVNRYNTGINYYRKKYNDAIKKGLTHTRENTEYNDLLNNNFQLAQKFCKVENGVIVSLDTTKLFYAFKNREKDAIDLFRLLLNNYKVGSIPKDRVFQKLRNRDLFERYANGQEINVWELSTYIDGSSTTLGESGLTIQYYESAKAILNMGNMNTDMSSPDRDIVGAYRTLVAEGLMPEIEEIEKGKVDGYTSVLATIKAQLQKMKNYSVYAGLLLGSGILNRDAAKKVVTPVSYQGKPVNAFKAKDSKIDAAMRHMISRFTMTHLVPLLEKVKADTKVPIGAFFGREFRKNLQNEINTKLQDYQQRANSLTEAEMQEYALFEMVNQVWFGEPSRIQSGASLGRIVDRGGLFVSKEVDSIKGINTLVKSVLGGDITTEFDYNKINNSLLSYLEQDRQNMMAFNQITSIETEEFQEAMNNKSTAQPLMRVILALADYLISPVDRISNTTQKYESSVSWVSRSVISALRHHITRDMFNNYKNYFEADESQGKFTELLEPLKSRFEKVAKDLGLNDKQTATAKKDFLDFLKGYYSVYKATNQMVFNTKSSLDKQLAIHAPLINQSHNTSTSWNILTNNMYQEWMSFVDSVYRSFIEQYHIKNPSIGLLDNKGQIDENKIKEYRKKNPEFNYELESTMRHTFKRLVDKLTERIFVNQLMQVLPSLSSLSQIEQKQIKSILSRKDIGSEDRLKMLLELSQEQGWGLLEEAVNKMNEVYTTLKTFRYTNWRTTFANVMPLINHSLEALVTQRIVLENSLLKQVYDSMEQYAPMTIESIRAWNRLFIELAMQMKLSHSDVLLNIESQLNKQVEEVRKELGPDILDDQGNVVSTGKNKISTVDSKRIHDTNMNRNNKRRKQKLKFLKSLFPIAANAIKEFTTKFGNIKFIDSFDEQFLANSLSPEEQEKLARGDYGNAKQIYTNRITNLVKEVCMILAESPSLANDFLFDEMNEYVDINGNVYPNPLKQVLDFYNNTIKKAIGQDNLTIQDIVAFFNDVKYKTEIDTFSNEIGDSLDFIGNNPLDIIFDTRLIPKDTSRPTIPLEENPFGEIDTSNVASPNQAAHQAIVDVVVGVNSNNDPVTLPEMDTNVDTDEIISNNPKAKQWRVYQYISNKFSTFGDILKNIKNVFKNAIMYDRDGVIDVNNHGRNLGNINPLAFEVNIDNIDIDELYSNKLMGVGIDRAADTKFRELLANKKIKTLRDIHIANIKRMLLNHIRNQNFLDTLITDVANETQDIIDAARDYRLQTITEIINNLENYPHILHTIDNGSFTFELKPTMLMKRDSNLKETNIPLKELQGIKIQFKPDEFKSKDFYTDFLLLAICVLESEKKLHPTDATKREFSNTLLDAIKSIKSLYLDTTLLAKDSRGNINLVATAPTGHIPTPLETIRVARGRGVRYVSPLGEGIIFKLYEDLATEYYRTYGQKISMANDIDSINDNNIIANMYLLQGRKKRVNTAIRDSQNKQEITKNQTDTQNNPPAPRSEPVKKKTTSEPVVARESISIARQHPSNGPVTPVKKHLTNKQASMQRLRSDLKKDRDSLTADEKDIEEVFDFADNNLGLIEDTTEYIVSNESSRDAGYTEVYDYQMDDNGSINVSTETSIVVFPQNRNFNKFTRLHETIHALTMIAMSHPATRTLMASLTNIFNQVRDYLLEHPEEIERLFGGHPNLTAKERFDYVFNTNKDDATNPYRRQAEFIATFLSEPKLFKFLKGFKLNSNYADLSSNTLIGKVGSLIRRILEAIGNAIFRIFTGSALNVTNAGAETLHIARMLSNFSSFNTVESANAKRLVSGVESIENTIQDGIIKPLFHMATLGIFKSIGARIKDGTLTQAEVDLAKADVKFSLRSKDINMANVVRYLRNPDVPKVAKYAMVTTLVISHTLQLGKNMINRPAIRSAFIDLYIRNMQIITEGTIFDIQVMQDLGIYRGESFMKRYNTLMGDIAGKNQYIAANSERFAQQLKDYSLKIIRESKLVKALNMSDKEIEQLDNHLGAVIWKLGLGDSVREGVNYRENNETTQDILTEMTSHLLSYKGGYSKATNIISYTSTEMMKYFENYIEDLEKEGHITGIKVTKEDRQKIFNFLDRATHDLALQRVQGYSYSDAGFTNAEQVIDMALKAFMLDKAKENKSQAVRDRIENHIRYGKTSIMSNKHIANSIRQVSILKAIETLKTHSIYDTHRSIVYFNRLKRQLESKGLRGGVLEELLHTLSKERNAILEVSRKELQLDYKKAFEYLKKGYKFTDKRIQDKIYKLESRFGDSIKGYHHYDSYTPYRFNPDVSIVKIYRKNERYEEQKKQLENLGYTKFYDFVTGELYKYDGIINYNQTTNNYGFIHNNDAPLGNISGLLQNDFEEEALDLDDVKNQTHNWGKSVLADYYNRKVSIDNYIQEAIDIRFNSADTTVTRVANSLVKFRAVLPRDIYEKVTQQETSMSEFMFNATKEAFVKQKRQTINNLTYMSIIAQQDELNKREFGHHTAILGEVKEVFNEYTGRNERRFVWNKDTLEKYSINLNNDDAKELHNITEMYQEHNDIGDRILVDTRLITYYFGFKPLNLLELVSPNKGKDSPASPTVIKAVGWFQTILKKWIKEVRKNTIILNPNLTTQNFISNFMGLIMYRIPFKKIMYDGFKYARELEVFLELQKQEAEVVKNLHKQRKGTIKYYEALHKVGHIRKSIEANPIYPLYKEGLYTNLVEDMDERNQIDRGVVNFINKMVNKNDNPTISAWIEEGLLTNKSDTYNMLARWNRYGDFIPRVILYYYEREQGTNHRQAIRLARETFVDYTLPLHSKVFRNLDAFGLINYAKYKFRVQRVILRNFRESPLRAFGLIATNELTGINSMSAWLYENILQDGLSSGIVGGLGNMAKNSIRYNTITNFPSL